jgi:hypothetical protein
MNCLDNVIGIDKKCTPTTPSSGLYIQDLPGITLKVANAAANEETISGIRLIEDKISFAQNALLSHLRMHFANKLNVKSIIENDTIGFYQRDLTSVALEAGKYKGIKARLDHPNLEFFIGKIFLQLSQAVTTDILIIDLMTGETLDTLPITTVANVPTSITVNKSYSSNRQRKSLFIGIDSEVSNTFKTIVSSNSNCSSCGETGYSNKYISFNGAKVSTGSQKIELNVESNSGTNGLSLEYSLNCSVESFLCGMANQLAWPLLHKVGAELMTELIYSKRLNSIVVLDKTDHKELLAKFEAEYIASMTALIDNIKLPNDICFSCNSKVRKTTMIP